MRRLWPQLPRRTPRGDAVNVTQGRAGHIRGRRRRPRPLDSRNGRGSEPTGRFQKGCPVTLLRRKASPREEAGKGKGLQGPSLGGVPAEDPDLELFQGGVTRVSAPGPGPAEERSSMKRPPGGPNCRDNEATGIEPGCSAVLGWGLPRDGVRAGQEEAPCLEGRRRASRPLSHKGLLQTARSAPGRQTCPRRALNTQEACSPPHLAEPREGFLGAKPSNRALRASDPRGPDAADLSAILGGQDG